MTREQGTFTRPDKRSRNSSLMWMFFSTVWFGILFGGLIRYWQIPDNSPYDTPVALGFRLLAAGFVIVFVSVYAYSIYRMYFNRTSWLVVFSQRETWTIRAVLTGLAIALNVLPSADRAGWQVAFMFVAIAWALTSNHHQAVSAVFQAAAIGAVTLIAVGREDIVPGTMLYVVGFGVMVAGYVMNNGLVGELMVERGRVKDQAATDERYRIARDLHDTVGHSMTQITLKAELARRMLATDADRAATELEQIEQLSRNLAREIRSAVEGDEHLGFAQEVVRSRELLESMSIVSSFTGATSGIEEGVDGVLAWCLREGVMNVVKHSGANRCEIDLQMVAGETTLTIRDNGTHEIGMSRGQGIKGMTQRVEPMGGSVTLDTMDNGHSLTIMVPTP